MAYRKACNTWGFPKFQKMGNWREGGLFPPTEPGELCLPALLQARAQSKNTNAPCPGRPAHLDLDAEDGPVLGRAEGLQPRQVGKAHGVTAQRVHVLVTATLCHGRGQTTAQGHQRGAGNERGRTGHRLSSCRQLCICTKSPSPLSTLVAVPSKLSRELLITASSQPLTAVFLTKKGEA